MTQPRSSLDLIKRKKPTVLDLSQASVGKPHNPVRPRPVSSPQRAIQGDMDSFRYGLSSARTSPRVNDVKQTLPSKTPPAEAVAHPKARQQLSRRRKLWSFGQYPVIAAIALGAAYTTAVGQWFVLAYGIFALIRHLDSRYSFGAALFALICVPLFSALGQSGISANIAVYVYELLVVGTVQAVIELRRSGVTAS